VDDDGEDGMAPDTGEWKWIDSGWIRKDGIGNGGDPVRFIRRRRRVEHNSVSLACQSSFLNIVLIPS